MKQMNEVEEFKYVQWLEKKCWLLEKSSKTNIRKDLIEEFKEYKWNIRECFSDNPNMWDEIIEEKTDE